MEDIFMKKTVIFFILSMVLIGSCAAQNVNNASRLIGTWDSNNDNSQWVFYSNGTGLNGNNNNNNNTFKYGASETMVVIIVDKNDYKFIYYYSLSLDGKTLIFYDGNRIGHWLTKR
jgi:hypothetical protein